MFQNKLILLSLLSLLGGCAATNKNQYYWGNYETVIYGHHLKQDEFSAQQQIEVLTKDIDLANANGKPIAPGVYAHLGMLYASIGDSQSAIQALDMEKQLYPDSKVLIDGLEKRLKQAKATTASGAGS